MSRSLHNRILTAVLHALFLTVLAACEKDADNMNSSYFIPLELEDWEVSSPGDQGLDTVLIKEMYGAASKIGDIDPGLVD